MTRLTDALERARHAEANPANGDIPPTVSTPDAPSPPDEGSRQSVARPPVADAKQNRFAATEPEADEVDEHPVSHADYHIASDAAVKLVVGPAPNHTLVEQFRHLAAALHHAQLKQGVRTVMVSSAVESEGKTTTAANIALTLSHSHQRRVLLIDADLRRPSLHTLFQVANRDGLGDYLRDFSPSRKRPVVHTISPTLSLLTAGRPTQDPMSALVSEEMKDVIEEAADHFDWVVVDTPPVALLSDANLLGAMIDVAILVVRANSTAYPLVQRALGSIGAERVLGVVLNRASPADLAVGYGYYYGYSYKPQEPAKRGILARLLRRG